MDPQTWCLWEWERKFVQGENVFNMVRPRTRTVPFTSKCLYWIQGYVLCKILWWENEKWGYRKKSKREGEKGENCIKNGLNCWTPLFWVMISTRGLWNNQNAQYVPMTRSNNLMYLAWRRLERLFEDSAVQLSLNCFYILLLVTIQQPAFNHQLEDFVINMEALYTNIMEPS